MKMVTTCILDRKDLESLNYRLIAEQSGSSMYQSSKVQKLLVETFPTEEERSLIHKICVKASRWYLIELPKSDVEMDWSEYIMWSRFKHFLIENCTYYGRNR